MFARQIVVVENESLLRDLLAKALEAKGFSVTTAANASDARRAIAAVDPDAIVVDIELGPGPSGFDLVESLEQEAYDLGVVYLTNLPDPRFAGRERISSGKNIGYLRKSQLTDATELVNALEAVLKDSASTNFRHDLASNRPLGNLSRKQIGVLKMVSDGLSNAQIAEVRGTTVRAVEGIISRIFDALEIDPSAEGNARVEASRRYLQATSQDQYQIG
jgi:DNA-binding NarL/FixJ family response regulator